MAERLQDSDFQRFFLIRVRLLYRQEAQIFDSIHTDI